MCGNGRAGENALFAHARGHHRRAALGPAGEKSLAKRRVGPE